LGQNEKFNFNNVGSQRPKYFSPNKLSREAMVAIIVNQRKSKQHGHFRGVEKGLSLSNNNRFSRGRNLGRGVRRDVWSRSAQGRGYSRSFSTAAK